LSCTVIFLTIKNIKLTINIKEEKEQNKKKQHFLANLIHDLKTPTNAQLSTLKMLNNETFGSLTLEQHEMITLTHNSCKYMSDLIGTIMETYSHDNGEVQLQKNNFDIIKLIEDISEELKSLYIHNNQEIEFRKEDSKCMIYADKLQIKRVLSNLLANAITYGFDNTIITITLKHQKNHIEIIVKNISKQIPKKELNSIFDRYTKTQYAKYNKTSNGLGLYLSKKIVELHKGKIYAKSFTDGTCIFGFNIPTNSDNHPQLVNA
jgi:signal transduction histidine kinase